MGDENKKDQGISRKKFVSFLSWGGLFAFLGGSGIGSLKFMFPKVLYEPPKIFKIGRVEEFGLGVDTRLMRERRIWVTRDKEGIYVMIGICRHLGCTPNWIQDQQTFRCPCHGSIYDIYGNVIGGPAPRPLWRAAISLDPMDGMIVVNTLNRQDPDPKTTPQGLVVEETVRRVGSYFLKI